MNKIIINKENIKTKIEELLVSLSSENLKIKHNIPFIVLSNLEISTDYKTTINIIKNKQVEISNICKLNSIELDLINLALKNNNSNNLKNIHKQSLSRNHNSKFIDIISSIRTCWFLEGSFFHNVKAEYSELVFIIPLTKKESNYEV